VFAQGLFCRRLVMAMMCLSEMVDWNVDVSHARVNGLPKEYEPDRSNANTKQAFLILIPAHPHPLLILDR
jgi:hypothetical protein